MYYYLKILHLIINKSDIQMNVPTFRLQPGDISGFLQILEPARDDSLIFIPISSIPTTELCNQFSDFIFSFSFPSALMKQTDQTKHIKISISEYDNWTINGKELFVIMKNNDNKTFKIEFSNSFYFSVFFAQFTQNHICFQSLDAKNNYNISQNLYKKINVQRGNNTFSRKSLLLKVNDLYAHQSLLEFIGLPFEGGKPYISSLVKFDEKLLTQLIDDPYNDEVRGILAKTKTPNQYLILVWLLLLLDKPSNPNEKNKFHEYTKKSTLVTDEIVHIPPIPQNEKMIPVIDNLCFGGATDMVDEYNALKLQWSTITVHQYTHMNRFKISMKLLENALLSSFPSSHPIIQIVFNAFASFSMIKDEFTTFNMNYFQILVSVAQMFINPDLIFDIEPNTFEHLIFWSFYSMIKKIGLVQEQYNREPLVLITLNLVMQKHPLLYNLLIKNNKISEVPESLKFLDNYLSSLFAQILHPQKMLQVWVSALASPNPMMFICNFLACSMIMVYPQIVDSENPPEELKKVLNNYLESTDIEILLSNTLKYMAA